MLWKASTTPQTYLDDGVRLEGTPDVRTVPLASPSRAASSHRKRASYVPREEIAQTHCTLEEQNGNYSIVK